jgi:polar amino acid transport system permease protein
MFREFGWAEIIFIINSAKLTLGLSFCSLFSGAIVGVAVAGSAISANPMLRSASRVYMRAIQGTPILLQIFIVFFGLDAMGFNIPPFAAAVVALAINAGAFFGDIWRGAVQSVPRGLSEAARSLGLSAYRTIILVVLPLAARRAAGPTVGFVVQLIKATSLASMVGVVEVTYAGQAMNNVTLKPFLVFGLVALIYFALCFPLTFLSKILSSNSTTGQRKKFA